jgi:hypothetical protein
MEKPRSTTLSESTLVASARLSFVVTSTATKRPPLVPGIEFARSRIRAVDQQYLNPTLTALLCGREVVDIAGVVEGGVDGAVRRR